MGRIDAKPRALSRTHRRFGTPDIPMQVVLLSTLLAGIILGLMTGGRLNVYEMLGIALTLIGLLAYILVSEGSCLYYLGTRRKKFNLVIHAVVPPIAIWSFIPVFIVSLGIDLAGLGIKPVTGDAVRGFWIDVDWMASGAAPAWGFLNHRPGGVCPNVNCIWKSPCLARRHRPRDLHRGCIHRRRCVMPDRPVASHEAHFAQTVAQYAAAC
jgi:hypothetical protein